MRAIFISYRRSDSDGQATSLLKDLTARFGKDAVFMDVTGIAKGLDFRRVLEARLATCGVLLAVIGKDWLEAVDEDGSSRLGNPKDFVRLEIAAALKRGIPVIPVLVRGARMPRAENLPEDLQDLVFRDGVELTHARWDSDVRDLIRALEPHVDASGQGLLRWPWRAAMGLVVLVLLGAAAVFGYGRYREDVAREARAQAEALEAKRLEAERVAAAQAALVKEKQDAEERARQKAAADEEKRARLKKEAEAKAARTQDSPASPLSRVLASKETGDTVQFLRVWPPMDTPLKSGTPTEFRFRLHYNLQSRDKAVLAVSIAQTRESGTGCSRTAEGQLIDADNVAIQRGEGTLDLSVLWHGGQTKSGVQPKGFLFPSPSLWEYTGGAAGRGKFISGLDSLPEACWRFGP